MINPLKYLRLSFFYQNEFQKCVPLSLQVDFFAEIERLKVVTFLTAQPKIRTIAKLSFLFLERQERRNRESKTYRRRERSEGVPIGVSKLDTSTF